MTMSSSSLSVTAGKEVVRRNQGGAVVVASSTSSKRKRPPKTALEEDEFTDALTKIVRRDFFPDIAKMEAQLEFIEATETNDYERLRAISERFPTSLRTPNPTRVPPVATPSTFETPLHHEKTPAAAAGVSSHSTARESTDKPPVGGVSDKVGGASEPPPPEKLRPEDHTLDRFLSKFESEDDASFSDIMEKTQEQHRAKHAWLYEKEEEYRHCLAAPKPLRAITDGGTGGGEVEEEEDEGGGRGTIAKKRDEPERSGVKSWTYTAKNSLMYIPDGLERSAMEKLGEPEKKREVVHSNTRLTSSFLRKMRGTMTTPGGTSEGGEGSGEGGVGRNKDKVGVDGKVLDPSNSPQINGYGFVATPQIQPGVDASPLMTWGSIDGTPVHLETDIVPGPGPTFKMPKIHPREELGHRLADKATKTTRERRKAAAATAASPAVLRKRLGTPSTPAERLKLLSPAARKLVSRTATPNSSRGVVDKALRQSYTPQRASRTPTSTPSSSSSSTPRPSSTRTTPRTGDDGSSTPSLTDNLLDLKNR